MHNFCKIHLKRPGSVPCQKSNSDTLQTSVPEDLAIPARWMVYVLLHLICILPTHQASAASVPRVRVTSLQDKREKNLSPLLHSEHCFFFFLCRNFSPYQPSSATPAWNRFLAARALASFMLHLLTRTEDQGPWNTARMLPPQPFLEQAHKSTARFSPDLSEMHQPPPATSTWTGMLLFRVTFFPHQIWPRLVGSCCWVKCIFFWHTDAFVWLALLFLRDHPQPMQLSP